MKNSVWDNPLNNFINEIFLYVWIHINLSFNIQKSKAVTKEVPSSSDKVFPEITLERHTLIYSINWSIVYWADSDSSMYNHLLYSNLHFWLLV